MALLHQPRVLATKALVDGQQDCFIPLGLLNKIDKPDGVSADCQSVSGAKRLRNNFSHDDDGQRRPDHGHDAGGQSVQQDSQGVVHLEKRPG